MIGTFNYHSSASRHVGVVIDAKYWLLWAALVYVPHR